MPELETSWSQYEAAGPTSFEGLINAHNHSDLIKPVNSIWQELIRNDKNRNDFANDWLVNNRGFDSPKSFIGSGFVNLYLEDISGFEYRHRKFLESRLKIGANMIVPMRSSNSDKVQNLFFRCISDCNKNEKTRLLTGAGGWHDEEGSPRAFGFPHLIWDFPCLVLCEGMADYFAAECLLAGEESIIPIGASNSLALKEWAQWLVKAKYLGHIIFVYQLDKTKDGNFSSQATGQLSATSALKIVLDNKLKGELFNWPSFLKKFNCLNQIPEDLAAVCKLIKDKDLLRTTFLNTLKRGQ